MPTPEEDVAELRRQVADLRVELAAETAERRTQSANNEKALQLARDGMEHWKAGSNEWRQALMDQRATQVTRSELEACTAAEAGMRQALDVRLALLEKDKAATAGKWSLGQTAWLVAVGLVALIASVLAILEKLARVYPGR